eukprot:1065509-Rhodomonas_salina.1
MAGTSSQLYACCGGLMLPVTSLDRTARLSGGGAWGGTPRCVSGASKWCTDGERVAQTTWELSWLAPAEPHTPDAPLFDIQSKKVFMQGLVLNRASHTKHERESVNCSNL